MALACKYDAPIHKGELDSDGFNKVFHFKFDSNDYFIIMTTHGNYYFRNNAFFNPYESFDSAQVAEFITFSTNHDNLYQLNIGKIIGFFSTKFNFECGGAKSDVHESKIKMFCLESYYASQLRFKLLCAFGLLRNFINPIKFNLIIRGGMALRLHLNQGSELLGPNSAPYTDMDGLIIVNPSVSPDELEEFKTAFMRLLILSIKSSVDQSDHLFCAVASNDAETIKIKLKRQGGKTELGDIGFKRADNVVIQAYSNSNFHKHLIVKSITAFPYVWVYPSAELMQFEYAHVIENITQHLKGAVDNPYKSKLNSDLIKFKAKHGVISRKYGGKKWRIRRKHRTQRRCKK